MPNEADLEKQLTEEHKDDFTEAKIDTGTTETSIDDKGNDDGRDNSQDKPEDEATRTNDSSKDDKTEQSISEGTEEEKELGKDKGGSTESNDSDDTGTEQVGEKKDANSRIRQILEEKKQILAEKEELSKKLAEREEAERKIIELENDPVYKVDDFVGTVDENGDPLTDGEAVARFRAWESDYKLRQYQKTALLKDQQDTLIKMQSETKEAFVKFPEFDGNSDKYDPQLAEIANEAFRAGLIYRQGNEGDDRYIIGSRVNPGQLLEKLHNLRTPEPQVTKVNNLGDDTGKIVSSQQVNQKVNKYAPGFRGEVDAELDKLIKQRG